MADGQGYIYRREQLTAAELHDLVGSATQGWAAEPTSLWEASDSRALHTLGDEGRATVGVQEFRWRRSAADGYDVLCLSLSAEAPAGFAPLSDQKPWRIRSTACRKPGPGRTPQTDHELPATAFLSSNGAVQFVALIDAQSSEGVSHGL